ncbi:MAG: hypothetical protein ACLSVD_05150 [Eggerthellaceae bacterium]
MARAAGFAAVALCIGFALVRDHAAQACSGFVAGTVLISRPGGAQLAVAVGAATACTSYLFLLGSHAAATALCAIVLQYPQEWYIPRLASLLAACATRLRVARPIERTFSSQIAGVAPLVGKGVLAVFALLSGFVTNIGATRHRLISCSTSCWDFRLRAVGHRCPRCCSPAVQAGRQLPRGCRFPRWACWCCLGLTEAVPPLCRHTGHHGLHDVWHRAGLHIAEVGKAARIPVMPLYAAATVSLLCLLAGTEAGALTRAPSGDGRRVRPHRVGNAVPGHAGCFWLMAASASRAAAIRSLHRRPSKTRDRPAARLGRPARNPACLAIRSSPRPNPISSPPPTG